MKIFKRKIYDELLKWKNEYDGKAAVLIEGARRVGKSTIATEFAKNEYTSFILIDFANASKAILDTFGDISNLDLFFLRLQSETRTKLYERKSIIVFDEVQLFPKARQAIKYLVKDGRYDYIETGSLISIKKNVKNILIPSEEVKLQLYPMDFEEFCMATEVCDFSLLHELFLTKGKIGGSLNGKFMKSFRLYMAVGGMPQAVEAYVDKCNFEEIDHRKRNIIDLYMDDLMKLDGSGRLSLIYKSVPSQLAIKKRRFVMSFATGKQQTTGDAQRLAELIDAKLVLVCNNVAEPSAAMSQLIGPQYKLYMSDVGLFTTMLFDNGRQTDDNIYSLLLRNSTSANLGYLYENVVAQEMIAAGRKLYYHTWKKAGDTRDREVDFLLVRESKVVPVEVKSGKVRSHKSIDEFERKYAGIADDGYLFCDRDVDDGDGLKMRPMYLMPFCIR